MSLQTALRFEADAATNSNYKKAYENQVERIKYDEKMADRENIDRLHKYNDFWDVLVKDIDHIIKKSEGIEVEEEGNRQGFEHNTNLRAKWNENLEEASWKKRINNENGMIKGELKMATKAALSVRRVALKQLFEREMEMFEKELSLVGKTFYKQRI